MQGVFSNAKGIYPLLMIFGFPRMSLHFKLVPDQYREHEYGCSVKFCFRQVQLNFGRKVYLFLTKPRRVISDIITEIQVKSSLVHTL